MCTPGASKLRSAVAVATGASRSSKSQRQEVMRAVRVEGGAAVEADRRAGLDREIGAGGGHRRRVHRHLDLVDVEGFRQAGLVAHGELHPLQARLG